MVNTNHASRGPWMLDLLARGTVFEIKRTFKYPKRAKRLNEIVLWAISFTIYFIVATQLRTGIYLFPKWSFRAEKTVITGVVAMLGIRTCNYLHHPFGLSYSLDANQPSTSLCSSPVYCSLESFFTVFLFFFKSIFNGHLLQEHKLLIERANVVSHKIILQQSRKTKKRKQKEKYKTQKREKIPICNHVKRFDWEMND